MWLGFLDLRPKALQAELRIEEFRKLHDRWQDEASEAAIEGNPQRAGYIEHMISRAFEIIQRP